MALKFTLEKLLEKGIKPSKICEALAEICRERRNTKQMFDDYPTENYWLNNQILFELGTIELKRYEDQLERKRA